MKIINKASCLFILLILFATVYVHAGEQPPDWWKAQREVVAILMEQKKDIAELADPG